MDTFKNHDWTDESATRELWLNQFSLAVDVHENPPAHLVREVRFKLLKRIGPVLASKGLDLCNNLPLWRRLSTGARYSGSDIIALTVMTAKHGGLLPDNIANDPVAIRYRNNVAAPLNIAPMAVEEASEPDEGEGSDDEADNEDETDDGGETDNEDETNNEDEDTDGSPDHAKPALVLRQRKAAPRDISDKEHTVSKVGAKGSGSGTERPVSSPEAGSSGTASGESFVAATVTTPDTLTDEAERCGYQKKMRDLEKKMLKLRKINDDIRKKSGRFEKKNKRLDKKNKDHKKRMRSLRKRVVGLEKRNRRHKEELQAYKGELRSCTEELRCFKGEVRRSMSGWRPWQWPQ